MSLMVGDADRTEFEEGLGSKVLRCARRWATIQTWAGPKRSVFFVALTSERQYDWLVNGLPARHDTFDTPIKLCMGSLCRKLNLCRALRSFGSYTSAPRHDEKHGSHSKSVSRTHSQNTHIKGEFLGSHHFPPTLLVSIPHQIDTQPGEMKGRRIFNLFRLIFRACFSRYCPQGYTRCLLVDSFLLCHLQWTGSELHSGFVMICLHLGSHHLSICLSITFPVALSFSMTYRYTVCIHFALSTTLLVHFQ